MFGFEFGYIMKYKANINECIFVYATQVSDLTKLEFNALDVSGDNYFFQQLETKLHLQSNKLDDSIKQDNTSSHENKSKTLILLHCHIHDDLKAKIPCEDDPLNLCTSLKDI